MASMPRRRSLASTASSLPRVAIVGVGGVGGVLGASLATDGRCKLILVARGGSLAQLRTEGLVVPWPPPKPHVLVHVN